jgi:filamentous hemagglutinin
METGVGNVLAHAALGCGVAALRGGGCVSGAVGGATSAVVAPLVGSALGIETNADRADPVNRAVVTAVAMLAGGGLAAALGQDATAAAGAAQNEALNNYLSSKSDRQDFEKASRECANGVLSSCAAANIYAETDRKNNDALTSGLSNCEGSSCQELANWIQDQKTAYGCASAASSVDCQALDKGWEIAQAKAQGLELPTFSPDDLIGTGVVKGLLTGTLKGIGLLGVTRSAGGDAARAPQISARNNSAIRSQVLDNIAATQTGNTSSQFSQLASWEMAYNFYRQEAGFSADGGVRNSVCWGRLNRSQRRALVKRSPKRMANWLAACFQVMGGIFQSFSILRKAR